MYSLQFLEWNVTLKSEISLLKKLTIESLFFNIGSIVILCYSLELGSIPTILKSIYAYFILNIKNVTTDLKNREKSEKLKLVMENQEKSGENVKKSAISKFARNFLKLLLLQVIVVIF